MNFLFIAAFFVVITILFHSLPLQSRTKFVIIFLIYYVNQCCFTIKNKFAPHELSEILAFYGFCVSNCQESRWFRFITGTLALIGKIDVKIWAKLFPGFDLYLIHLRRRIINHIRRIISQ